MAFTAQQILDAFVERSADGASGSDDDELGEADVPGRSPAPRAVTFGLRCTKPFGYVRVWGPGGSAARWADCHIIVERYNGAVAVSREIAAQLPLVEPRPESVRITEHEIGYSCGKNYGRFVQALRPSVARNHYATARALVDDLINAVEKAGFTW